MTFYDYDSHLAILMCIRALHNKGPILASFWPPKMQKFPVVLSVYLCIYPTIPFLLTMSSSPPNDPDGCDTLDGNADSCQLSVIWGFFLRVSRECKLYGKF